MKLRYTLLTGIHSSTINVPTSNICPVTGTSCCDINMEHEMYTVGQRQLIKKCNSWLQIARKMSNDSIALESIFQMDLQEAKGRLHQFFSRIYGYNYKLHRNFFFGFFTDLEKYMAGQRGQLGSLIKNFFSQLRDSIVSLIERSGQVSSNPPFGNPSSTSSSAGSLGNNAPGVGGIDEAGESRRIRCLSDKVAQLQPFDDVDVRLHARMLEAYPPARMLVNVLSVTSKLLHHFVDQVVTQSQCVLGITRYRFCALCNAQSLSNVCPDSCSRLLSGCLRGDGPDEVQLAFIWPKLIDAVIMATERLERSFNFPAVNRNLQMEISEAITSLQTRYSETKSKFESECRFGSTGRRMPTLFNAIRSRSQDNRVNHSDISRWPMISKPNRQLNRVARSLTYLQSSPVSQEFLAWQTRQQPPKMMSGSSLSPKVDYSQSINGGISRDWDTSDKGNPGDAARNLVQQVNEIKETYLPLRNLFNGPAGDLCLNNSITFSGVISSNSNQNSSRDHCWNPPDLASTAPNPGITQILAQLYEASRRLYDASSNTKDPDTLIVQPPLRSNSFSNTYSRNPQIDPLSSDLMNDPLTANQFLAKDQWQGPSQSRMHNPYETVGSLGIESGSGGQPNTLQYPGGTLSQTYEQPSNQFINMFPVDPHSSKDTSVYSSALDHTNKRTGTDQTTDSKQYFNQKATKQWPHKPPSSYSNWDSAGIDRNNWESSGTTDLNIPIFQELTTETATTIATVVTTTTTTVAPPLVTTSTVLPSTSTQVVSTSTTSDETESLSSVAIKDVPTEPVTLRTPLIVPTASELDKHPSSTTQHYTEAVSRLSSFTDSLLPSTDQPNRFGFLPDDEDNTQIVSRQMPFQTSNSQDANSWHRPSSVAQRPFQEGSGEQGSGGKSVYIPQYQGSQNMWPPTKGESVDPSAPEFSYNEDISYSNRQPDKKMPFYPSTHKPAEDHRNSALWNTPPDKLASGFLERASGVSPNTNWDEDKENLHTGSSQWHDAFEGSGRDSPEVPQNPLPEDTPKLQSPIQSTLPPLTPRVENAPEILPHPPLPPPEVWVPAKLSPGQPVSPILLIREYSVEGPLYGKEDIVSHPYNSASCRSLFTFMFLPLITMFLF
ncbi:unnamed protein product [Heterobilharzia americana]|nr:unnamed protein product [Heterobilharzia americana]